MIEYPARLNPWHLLHKSGAVAMVFGPWEKRWIFGGWKFPTRRWTCWRFWRKWTNKNIHSWKLTWQWTTPLSMGNTSSNRGNSVAMLVFVGVIQPNSKGCSSCSTKPRLILPNEKKDMVNICHSMSKVLKISNSINSSLFDSGRLFCFFKMLRSCGRLGSVVKFKIFKDLHLEGTKKHHLTCGPAWKKVSTEKRTWKLITLTHSSHVQKN